MDGLVILGGSSFIGWAILGTLLFETAALVILYRRRIPSGVTQAAGALNDKLFRELEHSEHNMKSLFDSAFEGIVVHDHGIIMDANHAFVELCEVSLNDIIGTPLVDYFPGESDAFVQSTVADSSPGMVEVRRKKPDGSELTLELNTRPFNFGGHPARLTTVILKEGVWNLHKAS